jgi:hypothetical protein
MLFTLLSLFVRSALNVGTESHPLLQKLMTLERVNLLLRVPSTVQEGGNLSEILDALQKAEPKLYETPLVQLYAFLARLRWCIHQKVANSAYPAAERPSVTIPSMTLAPTLDVWHLKFFENTLGAIITSLKEAFLGQSDVMCDLSRCHISFILTTSFSDRELDGPIRPDFGLDGSIYQWSQ